MPNLDLLTKFFRDQISIPEINIDCSFTPDSENKIIIIFTHPSQAIPKINLKSRLELLQPLGIIFDTPVISSSLPDVFNRFTLEMTIAGESNVFFSNLENMLKKDEPKSAAPLPTQQQTPTDNDPELATALALPQQSPPSQKMMRLSLEEFFHNRLLNLGINIDCKFEKGSQRMIVVIFTHKYSLESIAANELATAIQLLEESGIVSPNSRPEIYDALPGTSNLIHLAMIIVTENPQVFFDKFNMLKKAERSYSQALQAAPNLSVLMEFFSKQLPKNLGINITSKFITSDYRTIKVTLSSNNSLEAVANHHIATAAKLLERAGIASCSMDVPDSHLASYNLIHLTITIALENPRIFFNNLEKYLKDNSHSSSHGMMLQQLVSHPLQDPAPWVDDENQDEEFQKQLQAAIQASLKGTKSTHAQSPSPVPRGLAGKAEVVDAPAPNSNGGASNTNQHSISEDEDADLAAAIALSLSKQ